MHKFFHIWRCIVVNGHFSRCTFLVTSNLGDCSCESSRYLWALIIGIIIFVGEIFGGYLTGSLALLSDAWHVFGDMAGLLIAFVAAVVARKIPAKGKQVKVWATQASAALLVGAIIMIVVGALDRLLSPSDIHAEWMVAIAFVGMVGNIIQRLMLNIGAGKRDALHMVTSAHTVTDAAQSAAIVIGGAVIWKTGWVWIDPALSIVIAGILCWWVVQFLRTGELGHTHSHDGSCEHEHTHRPHDHHHH